MTMLNLDFNATTPVDPQVAEVMLPWLQERFGNPSSSHLWGAEAAQALAGARREASAFLGCKPAEVIFTSGGTEANNLAIRGAAIARRPRGGHIVSSATEHPAVLRVLEGMVEECDYSVTLVPVDGTGLVDPTAVAAAIREETVLVTIMHANNETGAVQPIAAIAAALGDKRVLLHTDASQSAGKIPVRPADLGADLLTLAGHKIYGPKGIGLLYARAGISLTPIMRGAGQESGRRPGTEPVMLTVGMGRACALAGERCTPRETARLTGLRDRLQERLLRRLPTGVVHSATVARLPNTLSFAIPDELGAELVAELGDRVAFSAGAACHGEVHELSPVLRAMGVEERIGLGTIRLSLGHPSTEEDIEAAVELITETIAARGRA